MFSAEPVLFQVPVCAHVYKYLRVRQQGEPFAATFENAPMGTWLWAMIQAEKLHVYLAYKGRQTRYRKYNLDNTSHILNVVASEFHRSRMQNLLNIPEQLIFNRVVTKYMYDDLLAQLELRPEGQSLQAAIRNLADRYDFSDDDLSEDSLSQLYYRVKGAKTNHSFRQPNWSALVAPLQLGDNHSLAA